jgi:hypothetical protein
VFTLKHAKGSHDVLSFLADGKSALEAIPGVECFEVFAQVNVKTDFDFGFSMEFADRAVYGRYLADPAHVDFVERRWMKEVVRFMEIDLGVTDGPGT